MRRVRGVCVCVCVCRGGGPVFLCVSFGPPGLKGALRLSLAVSTYCIRYWLQRQAGSPRLQGTLKRVSGGPEMWASEEREKETASKGGWDVMLSAKV